MSPEFRKNGARDPGGLEAMLQAGGMSSDLIERYVALGFAPIMGGDGTEGEGEQSDEGEAEDESQAGSGGEESQDKGESISLEEAKKLRSESKNLRKRLKELESAQKRAEDSKLSEVEKISKERDEAVTEHAALLTGLKRDRVRAEAIESASSAGAIEPGAIAKLIDLDDVEFDDDLEPENVDDLIGALKKAHPRLFQAAQGGGNGGERSAGESEPKTANDYLIRGFGKKKR